MSISKYRSSLAIASWIRVQECRIAVGQYDTKSMRAKMQGHDTTNTCYSM